MAETRQDTSSGVLKSEKLRRTVPLSNVPAELWARGAQWSPARTAIPRSARASPNASAYRPSAVKDSTPAWA